MDQSEISLLVTEGKYLGDVCSSSNGSFNSDRRSHSVSLQTDCCASPSLPFLHLPFSRGACSREQFTTELTDR